MDPQDYPIRHMEQMVKLATALKSLPAQVLDHWYSYESFESWRMDLRFQGVAFRIVCDGKDGVLTLQRSTSKKHPYDWGQLVWERHIDGDVIALKEIVDVLRSAIAEE